MYKMKDAKQKRQEFVRYLRSQIWSCEHLTIDIWHWHRTWKKRMGMRKIINRDGKELTTNETGQNKQLLHTSYFFLIIILAMCVWEREGGEMGTQCGQKMVWYLQELELKVMSSLTWVLQKKNLCSLGKQQVLLTTEQCLWHLYTFYQ